MLIYGCLAGDMGSRRGISLKQQENCGIVYYRKLHPVGSKHPSRRVCTCACVRVCKCSDCRLSAFNLVSDTLLASLIKSPVPAGGFGRATRKTLSLSQIHHVRSRPPREQNTHPPQEETCLCKCELHFFYRFLHVLH